MKKIYTIQNLKGNLQGYVGFAFLYVLAFCAGEQLKIGSEHITPIIFTGAISTVYLLRSRIQNWAYYLCLHLCLHVALSVAKVPLLLAFLMGIGSILPPLLTAWVIYWLYNNKFEIENMQHFMFLVMLLLLSPSVGAIPVTFAFSYFITATDVFQIWYIWALACAVGALVVVPLSLLWLSNKVKIKTLFRRFSLQNFLLLVIIALMVTLLFMGDVWAKKTFLLTSYLLFPFLYWAAFRLSTYVISIILSVLTLVVVLFTQAGLGPFYLYYNNDYMVVFSLQVYVVFTVVATYIFSISIAERKALEKQLVVKERSFRASFEQSAVGMAHIDFNGTILRCNQKLSEMLGYGAHNIVNKPFYQFIIPGDSNIFKHTINQMYRGTIGECSHETRFKRKNGSMIWCNTWASVIQHKNKSQAYIMLVLQNITSKKRTENRIQQINNELEERVNKRTIELSRAYEKLKEHEQEIKASHTRLIERYKNLPMPTITFRKKTDDFVVDDYNNAFMKYIHEGAEVLNEKSYKNIFQNNDIMCAIIEQSFTNKNVQYKEIDLKFPKLTPKQVNITVGYVPDNFVVVHIEDVSEIRKAEKKRQVFFEVSLDMLCIAGTDGYFKQISPAWTKCLGWSEQELMAQPFINFVHPDDLKATNNAAARLAFGQNVVDFENRYLTKQGDYKWLSWRSYIEPDMQLIYAVARDIHKVKETEFQLKDYAKTQSELLKEVNHRVKNNLSAIISILHLEQDKAQENNLCDYYNLLSELVLRIRGLATVHSMLSAGNWQPVNLSDLCSRIIETSLNGFSTIKSVAVDIEHTHVEVESSKAHHLAMVINELASNSAKHAGNSIQLKIRVRFLNENTRLYIKYSDNGCGYPPEMIADPAYNNHIGFELINGVIKHNLNGKVLLSNNKGAHTDIVIDKSSINIKKQ